MSLTVPIYGFGCGGGGSELNFDVKDFRTEAELLASAGKENRIGVITPAPMTGWRFDANQPEDPQNGEVWIFVSKSSRVEFDALKKNGIQVYPATAKQYVSGAWVSVNAKTYQNGKWVEWLTYLFNYGKQEYKWSSSNMRSATAANNTAKAPTVTTLTDGSVKIDIAYTSNFTTGAYMLNEAFDFTEKNKLTFKANLATGYWKVGFSVIPLAANAWSNDRAYEGDAIVYHEVINSSISGDVTVNLDVSALSGSYKVCVGVGASSTYKGGSCTLQQVIVE